VGCPLLVRCGVAALSASRRDGAGQSDDGDRAAFRIQNTKPDSSTLCPSDGVSYQRIETRWTWRGRKEKDREQKKIEIGKAYQGSPVASRGGVFCYSNRTKPRPLDCLLLIRYLPAVTVGGRHQTEAFVRSHFGERPTVRNVQPQASDAQNLQAKGIGIQLSHKKTTGGEQEKEW
jgi:hypothetical protein